MKRLTWAIVLTLGTLPLSACYEGSYGVGMGWSSYPYDVWYDGHYGPFYDGYWGTDGFFYYRSRNGAGRYLRGDARHFHRGETPPNAGFRRYQGETRQPPRGARLPSYPSSGTNGPGRAPGGDRRGNPDRDRH